MASDIWMFGVCMWEILMYGTKPWLGVRNHDVILRIEADERLDRPEGCPAAVYDLLRCMWTYDAERRPTMNEVEFAINSFLDQLDRGIAYNLLTGPSFEGISASVLSQEASKTSVPVLRIDASSVPTSTIWRTLEQQRIQSEEDSKWLEEEEEKLLPPPSNIPFAKEHSLPKNDTEVSECRRTLPPGFDFDRTSDAIHRAVCRVIAAVAQFSKLFTLSMEKNVFVELIKAITDELKELLSETSQCLSELEPSGQRQVQMIETLLGSDMHSMANCVTAAFDTSTNKEDNELARRKVLQVANQLALNCKYFLESVDSARIESGVAKLKKIEDSVKQST